MKGNIRKCGKKVLSIVLTIVMIVGMINVPSFVDSVKAATAESTFYFYSTDTPQRIWCWSDTGTGNDCWPESLGNNWYKFTLSCTNGNEDGKIYFEVVGSTSSTRYTEGYTQGIYYGYDGDTTAYTSFAEFSANHQDIVNPEGESDEETFTFTLIDGTDSKWISNDNATIEAVADGKTYSMSGANGTWTVELPVSVTEITINRKAPDGGTWNSWNTGDRGGATTYTATVSGAGTWSNKIESETTTTTETPVIPADIDIYGTPLTSVQASDLSGITLEDIEDANTANKEELFVVPANFYSYKASGGSSWWNQFQDFDNAIMATYYGSEKMLYPLITGAPDTWNISGDAQGNRPLIGLTNGLDTALTNIQALYYINHNLEYSGEQPASAGIGNGGSPVQGLVAEYLNEDGKLLSAENNIIMPFFDDNFLGTTGTGNVIEGTWATKYGTESSPLSFPFRVNGTHYIFDSSSGKDNIQVNDDGTVVYNSSDSASVKNGFADYSGFYPFNTSADSGNAEALKYGFGAHMYIPFTVYNPDTEDATPTVASTTGKIAFDNTYVQTWTVDLGEELSAGTYTLVLDSSIAGGITWDYISVNGDTKYFGDNSWYSTEGEVSYLNVSDINGTYDCLSSINGKIIIPITVEEGQTIDSFQLHGKTYNSDYSLGVNVYNCAPEEIVYPAEDVVFNFSGDDDLWVYVDGKLVLDMGGSHGQASGSINFTKGTVTVNDKYVMDYTTGTVAKSSEADTTDVDWIKFDDPTETHTMEIFYMERGLYDSNLKIEFNFNPVSLVQENGLTVSNKMDVSVVDKALQDTIRKIMKVDKFNYELEDKSNPDNILFEDNKLSFTGTGSDTISEKIEDGEEGIRDNLVSIEQKEDSRFDTTYKITDINGDVIKDTTSGLKAEDGRNDSTGTVYVQNATVATESTDSVAVYVAYLNTTKVSGFSIEKQYEGTATDTEYTFEVKYTKLFGAEVGNSTYNLKGTLAGVSYTVEDADTGEIISTENVVDSNSRIKLKAGEKAVFSKIPVDTVITVQELYAGTMFKQVKVSSSDEQEQNTTYNVNNEISATIGVGMNIPEYVYVNGEPVKERLVYYTEIGKVTNLPLPSKYTAKITKTAETEKNTVEETTTISHEKSTTFDLDSTVEGEEATATATFSNVQATINDSNNHTIKITSPGTGGYLIRSITVGGTTFDATTIMGYLNNAGIKYDPLDGGIINWEQGTSITLPFTLSSDGDVMISVSYKGWNSSFKWPIVLDEGVVDTSTKDTSVTIPGTVYKTTDAVLGNAAGGDLPTNTWGSVENMEKYGSYFRFTNVDGGNGGSAKITVHYATENQAAEMYVAVNSDIPYMIDSKGNDNGVDHVTIATEDTGSWVPNEYSETVIVTGLKAGETNTLTFSANNLGYNVDYIVVELLEEVNAYDITAINFVHDAQTGARADVSYTSGDSDNALTITTRHVGYDKFNMSVYNNEEGSSEIVEVIVYNYNVANHIYVLDYGLASNLSFGINGIFGEKSSQGYNYENNISVNNASYLADTDDADEYTTLGFTKEAIGENFASIVAYGYGISDFANVMQFNQASVVLDTNSEVIYTPEKFMSDVDTFYYGVQVTKNGFKAGDDNLDATNATPVMTGKVDVMPASVVYYEDNFSRSGEDADGQNGIIYAGNAVTIVGSQVDNYQSNDLDIQYGYDEVYAEQSYGNSNGSSHALGYACQAAFEFTGTGFDIVSRTNQSTGTMIVNIYRKVNGDSTAELSVANNKIRVSGGTKNLVKAITINSYYENGDLYQVPLISWNSGEEQADDYIVVITSFDTTKSKVVYLDGVRIYNPIDTYKTVASVNFMTGDKIENNMSYKNTFDTSYTIHWNTERTGWTWGDDRAEYINVDGKYAAKTGNLTATLDENMTESEYRNLLAAQLSKDVDEITEDEYNNSFVKNMYSYFAVDSSVISSSANEVAIEVTYLDRGTGNIVLQYQTNKQTGTNSEINYAQKTVALTDTGEWMTTTIYLDDAGFRNSQVANASFRFINGNGESGLALARVAVKIPDNSDAYLQYEANKELGAEVKGIKTLIFGEDFEFNYDNPLESNIDEATSVASLVKFDGEGSYILSGKTVVEAFNGIDSEQKETDPNATKDLMTYAVNGPNNELYLEDGYGLGFYIDKVDDNAILQIAVKNISGADGLKLQYLSTDGWKDVATVKSATEVYYRLDTLDDLYIDNDDNIMVVLRASGDSGFISLTNLKVAGYELSSLVVDTPEGVLDTSLNATNFTFKSAYNTRTKSFNKNQNAIVKFITSKAVEEIVVQRQLEDGETEDVQLITASSKAKGTDTIEWTVKFKTTDSTVSIAKYMVTAYDESGNYSEAVSFE